MWSRHEIGLEGTYLAYFPFSPMIERPQIAPYHNKLKLQAELRTNLRWNRILVNDDVHSLVANECL